MKKKKFTIRRYVDNTIIYYQNCQKPPGRKLENKVAIFTFLPYFLLFLHINVFVTSDITKSLNFQDM